MAEIDTLKRHIFLNRQALKLLDAEYKGKRAEIRRRIEDAEERISKTRGPLIESANHIPTEPEIQEKV